MATKTTIPIGSDHAGFELKTKIVQLLERLGYEVKDFGAHSLESVDYPDFAHPVASSINDNAYTTGIVVCGSGQGVCMTVNKYQNVRGALSWNVEHTKMARLHNNANILCLPARFIDENTAFEMVEAFLTTDYEAGRHQRRLDKMPLQSN